jgi:hypothetical protein
MKIAGTYSFNHGERVVSQRYPDLLIEVKRAIAEVQAADHKTKVSKEKTMPGRMLFDPRSINKAFKSQFEKMGWASIRVACEYSRAHYVNGYKPRGHNREAFREMDFVKKKLGVEVQFGKYAFMVYNVCAKMTIFRNLKTIECGVEIVPVKAFAEEMSTGVSYFEQFLWDLEKRGVADIDVPVLILGIDE